MYSRDYRLKFHSGFIFSYVWLCFTLWLTLRKIVVIIVCIPNRITFSKLLNLLCNLNFNNITFSSLLRIVISCLDLFFRELAILIFVSVLLGLLCPKTEVQFFPLINFYINMCREYLTYPSISIFSLQ